MTSFADQEAWLLGRNLCKAAKQETEGEGP